MSDRSLQFSIMFFSASEEALGENKYRLVLEAARFADQHAFSSVWVPERHFATLGALYPNPSVLQAAVAAVTTRVALRAGSVVLPLHDPVRVAEEWSMVDNLSGGRVGVSFASGWNPSDFVFFPDRYAKRQEELFEAIPKVQQLWRGEGYRARGGSGEEITVKIHPRPVQSELPTWITAARSPETFIRAGEMGANVLSHLLDQDVEGMAEKVALYRAARERGGHDSRTGIVTVMLHTFVGGDADAAREAARAPYCEFLKSNASLLKGLAASRGERVDVDAFSAQEKDAFVNFLYDRFVGSRALIGSPETCVDLVTRLHAAGVDELACLLDFGPSYEAVLESLPQLDRLRLLGERSTAETRADRVSTSATRPQATAAPTQADTPEAVQRRCEPPIEGAAFYADLERRGLQIEGTVRAVERVWRRDGEAVGIVGVHANASASSRIAPPLLDACLQVALAAVPRNGADAVHMPTGFRGLELESAPGLRAWSHAVVRPVGESGFEADVRILHEDGRPAARVTGLRMRRAEPRRQAIHDWLYRVDWQRSAPVDRAGGPSGRWLILADGVGVSAALAARLERSGAKCVILPREDVFGVDESGPNDSDAFDRLREAIARARAEAELTGVVHLWSLDSPAPESTTRDRLEASQSWGSAAALVLIQSVLATSGEKPPRVWLVTRGAQRVVPGGVPVAFAQSPVWGLGRTCAMEHPEIWGGLVDLDPGADAETDGECVQHVLTAADGEDQVAFRANERYVARLVRAGAPEERPLHIGGDGAYLVTGGLWGLGLEVARWLVRRGARHLVLLGRTALPPREGWSRIDPSSEVGTRVAAVRDLEAMGAVVRYAPTNVADVEGIAALRASLAADGVPPIRGVVHAASVWRDVDGQTLIRTLAQLDVASLKRVFAPKVLGSWVLHDAFREEPLDFFVLFSSAASLTGSAGQGNYAAASSFLDGLAQYRRQTGRSALSVNWGPVSGTGFGATADGLKVHRYWEDNGLKRIDVDAVLRALEALIPSDVPGLGVMNINWEQLGAFFPGLARSRWASGLVTARGPRAQTTEFLVRLRAAPEEMRRDVLLRHVQEEVRRIMRLERLPDPRRRLFDMGMDSLMALDLKKRLQEQLAVDVPITAVFNYPTIDALVRYLADDVLAFEQGPPTPQTTAAAPVDPLAQIQQLTDDEAEQLLAEKLASGGMRP